MICETTNVNRLVCCLESVRLLANLGLSMQCIDRISTAGAGLLSSDAMLCLHNIELGAHNHLHAASVI